MITSDARMLHFQTLTDRVNRRELARQQMVNFWYHFHHNMPQRLGNKIAFGWLIVAMLLVDVANLVIQARRFPRMWARLIGHFGGLSHCLSQTKASNAKGKTEKTLDGAQ
jgi:hypothetical protein